MIDRTQELWEAADAAGARSPVAPVSRGPSRRLTPASPMTVPLRSPSASSGLAPTRLRAGSGLAPTRARLLSRSSASPSSDEALQGYLARWEEVHEGPVQRLKTLLLEARDVHARALDSAAVSREREALKLAELNAERASVEATHAHKSLQELFVESRMAGGSATEAALRRQSFDGLRVVFQSTLNSFTQEQLEFREKMEAKVTRQLQAAFPEADEVVVAAVAAGQGSAAKAIQESMLLQPGTGPLSTITAMQRNKYDELTDLVKAVRDLTQAFRDIDSRVNEQGEVIDDISTHISNSVDRTARARDSLQGAERSTRRRRCCVRWTAIVVIVAAVIVLIYFIVNKGH